MRRLVSIIFIWCFVYIAYAYQFYDIQEPCKDSNRSLTFSGIPLKVLPKNFIDSPWITCLKLSDNGIRMIDRGAFAQLPNLTRLHLSRQSFNEGEFVIPFEDVLSVKLLVFEDAFESDSRVVLKSVFPKLRYLSMRNNYAREITFPNRRRNSWDYNDGDYDSNYYEDGNSNDKIETSDVFPELEYLDLSQNKIEKASIISSMPLLKYLNMSNNLITNFKQILPRLETLILDFNDIRTVRLYHSWEHCLTLQNYSTLRHLSLKKNPIQEISSDAFSHTKNLEYLDLSNNKLLTLRPEMFRNLYSLKILRMTCHQDFTFLMANTELQIEELDLRGSNLRNVSHNMLQNMPHLRKLYLSNTSITNINYSTFSALSELEVLDLGMNRLSSFEEGWSESLTNLHYLNLEDNLFTSLESLALSKTMSIMDIQLGRNPLTLKADSFKRMPENVTVHVNMVAENTVDC